MSRSRRCSRALAAVLLVLAAMVAVVVSPSTPTASATESSALSPNVHLFYYPWYGAVNGGFRHWQQGARPTQ
jgi:glycoprotein endo-alpha-1,2-mannosidase